MCSVQCAVCSVLCAVCWVGETRMGETVKGWADRSRGLETERERGPTLRVGAHGRAKLR